MPMWLLPRSATPALVLRPQSVLSALAFFICAAPRVAAADPIDACIAAAEEGQHLRLEGELTFAREKFLACSHVECPAVLRADCTRWLSELEAVKPPVVVPAAPRRDDVPPPAEEKHAPPDRPIPAPPSPSWAAPVSAFAAAGVALGIGSYFWITGLSEHATLGSTCAPTHSCSESSIESAHDKLVIGDVAGAIGVGLAVIGVATVILRGHTARPSLVVAFSQAPGGALLSLGGDF
jgi:hypothetical protein